MQFDNREVGENLAKIDGINISASRERTTAPQIGPDGFRTINHLGGDLLPRAEADQPLNPIQFRHMALPFIH